jgi:hypothetical protein
MFKSNDNPIERKSQMPGLFLTPDSRKQGLNE